MEDNLIKSIPESFLVRSVDNPNSNHNVSIKAEYFTNITEINFVILLKDKKLISVKDVIHFFETNQKYNNNNTKGKYHELMPIVHAIYGVKVEHDLPKYQKLDDKIVPKRIEFLICWWINHIIQNDNFLKSYLKYIKPEYQTIFDDRFYDIVFNELDIIIEIQENNSTHEENKNDITKESLIRIRSKRILYFKCSKYDTHNYQYLNEFGDDLKKGLIASLLSKDRQSREQYCIYQFMNMIAKEKALIKPISKKAKSKLAYLNKFTEDSSMISKMFLWKEKTTSSNKYVIPIKDIQHNLQIADYDRLLEIIDSKYDSIDGCITWKTFNKLINLDSDIEDRDKESILEYLLSVEEIYLEICDLIKFHGDECLKNNISHFEVYEEHTKKKFDSEISKLKSKYETQVKKLDSELAEKSKLMKNMKKSIDKVNKSIDTYIDDKRNRNKLHKLLEFSSDIRELNPIPNIEFQKNINEPLLNKADFPIIYTNSIKDFIDKDKFNGICKAHGLTATQINNFIDELVPIGCSKNTTFIPCVKEKVITRIILSDSSESESESESDSDSDEKPARESINSEDELDF